MPANAVRLIRLVLSHAEQGAALECLELALAAARRAGARAVQDAQDLPPAEQLTLAIQAADEALVGLAVQLAEGDQDGEAQGCEKRGRSASPSRPAPRQSDEA